MNCNECTEKILDHALLEQTVADPEAAAHLEGCPACRKRLEFERSLAAGFHAIVTEEPPIELAGRVLNIPECVTAEERSVTGSRRQEGRAAVPETLVIAPEPAGKPDESSAARVPEKRPAREIPWWQAFWFRAGVSFAAAGFLLAIGVSQVMTTSSSVDRGRTDVALEKTLDYVKSAPQPAVAPSSEEMTMAAAPVVPEEAKEPVAVPEVPLPPPPVFEAKSAPPEGMQSLVSPGPENPTEKIAAAPAEPSADSGAERLAAVPANEEKGPVKAVEPARPAASASPPKVVGEPLVKKKGEKDTVPEERIVLAKQQPAAPVAPVAVQSKGLIVGGAARRASPSVSPAIAPQETESAPAGGERFASERIEPEVGDILLRKADAEGTEKTADDLAPDYEAGFAPPPPVKAAAERFRQDFIDETTIGVSPRKQARIEELMAAHAAEMREGPLDIDHWVLSGWITVKERIQLAPPEGMRWVAVRSGTSWKAEIRSKRRIEK
ncbi:MAG TPA: hypothetical protein PLU72_12725 [Candidatus Ozemobacteraceae bacterium]|nr:hypothetical protein [Candidatus Ozemobacteraceae bacterium]